MAMTAPRGQAEAITCWSSHGANGICLASVTGALAEDGAGWRELAGLCPGSAPFVDEAWVTACLECLRPIAPLLLRQRQDGRLVGLAALQSLTESWAGRRIAVLQSLTNAESYRFEFLSLPDRDDLLEQIWRLLCEARRWDVIRLDHVPDGSPTLRAGVRIARELGWRPLLEATFETPWRPLAPWDQGLTRKFKSNLRNRERRLEQLGEVTFEVARGGAGHGRALEAFYALEASGWKGERGTAIASRQQVRAFYDRLVEGVASLMWIPVLSVAGRPVAAQLIRVQGGTLFMHKTAYDPEYAPLAPGQLITARLIRYGIQNGMDTLDFLADNMPWKADWAPQLRRHYRLLLFSPSAHGRYAYWTRYGVREQARKIPGARRLVRWVHARAGHA
jgi:CelD/BcsL family acetyltransferase involved in cellulose biosynthesis